MTRQETREYCLVCALYGWRCASDALFGGERWRLLLSIAEEVQPLIVRGRFTFLEAVFRRHRITLRDLGYNDCVISLWLQVSVEVARWQLDPFMPIEEAQARAEALIEYDAAPSGTGGFARVFDTTAIALGRDPQDEEGEE